MFASIKAKAVSILAILWAAALPWLNAKLGLHMTDNHIHGNQGLCAMLLAHLWHEDVSLSKIRQLLAASGKTMAAGAGILMAFVLSGCSGMTPAQIQADTAIGVTLGLTGAVIFDPAEKPSIDKDVRTAATLLDQVIIPQFFPGANAGQLANAAVTQGISLITKKLAASPTGGKITEVLTLIQGPLSAALGATASPTAPMSAATQAQALGFFSGAAQGCATYLKDPTLNPPTPPPAPAPAPPAPPAPPPAPAPPK